MWSAIRPNARNIRFWQVGVLLAVFAFWHVMTKPGLIPPMFFDNDRQAAFFFGEPLKVAGRIWVWFVTEADIYRHLWVTLVETLLALINGEPVEATLHEYAYAAGVDRTKLLQKLGIPIVPIRQDAIDAVTAQ